MKHMIRRLFRHLRFTKVNKRGRSHPMVTPLHMTKKKYHTPVSLEDAELTRTR